MSLYIGNLSNHISREDLEHVFRKFGRCRIQMKDGFGFAVYEFRGNAERALRELRGRSICGEAVTLTWSNKQPKPYQTFGRANSFHDPSRERNVYSGDPGRRGFSLSRQGGRRGFNRFESVYGNRHHFTERFDEKKVHCSGDIGSSGRDVSQHSVEDVVAGPDSITPADSGRWDEASHMLPDLNGPAPADGAEFDRYDPYQSHEENDVDESDQMNYEEASESLGISPNGSELGRRSMDTLTEPILQGKDSGNTNHDNYEDRKAKSVESHERTTPRSRESSCSARETSSTSERNGPVLKQRQNVLSSRSSPCPMGTNTSQKNDNRRKRRSEIGNNREKIKQPKNMKRSLSSALRGQSPDGLRSTGLHSSFSYSMASSLSDESENGTQKSRSRSRSFSSLSPTGSHDQPLASSPQNSFLNKDNCVGNSTFPSSLEDPNEHVELLKGGRTAELRTAELRTAGCDASTAVAVEKTGISDAEKPYSSDLDQNRGLDGQDVGALALSPDTIKISSRKSLAESLDASQEASYEHLPPLDDNDALMKEDEAASADGVQASRVRSNSARHSGLLSEDIFMVLNHYGLEVTKENEKRQEPAEEFFGCARMWPWPIIYYRRLRKGPISVDNYARRVLQNKEYGIIDKFVRSSSGWGELKDLAD